MARGRIVTRVGSRRQTTWIAPADQGFVSVTTGSTTLIASFDPTAAGLPRPTVVRTRGSVAIAPVIGIAADVDIVGAYGLAVVSENAFGQGVSAIPQPFDDANWDGWFVWRSFSIRFESNSALTAHINQLVQEVDSKAMRKMGDGDRVVLIAQSQVGAYDISMPLRMLMKLS